jgi:FkbM family methyltransferase
MGGAGHLSVEVLLPNGMVVACHQKHEVPLVQLEVQSYFGNGVRLNAGDTMFDVGANIGLFSLAAYQHCDSDLRIFAFEPVAPIFELLQANCERNIRKPHVNVFRCGLSHRSGTVDLAYYPRAPVLSTSYPDREADLQILKEIVVNSLIHLAEAPVALRCLRCVPRLLRGPLVHWVLRRALVPVTARCEMRTLSEVISEYGVGRIDLLKVDVEKAELDVLNGIDGKDWPKIQQVAVEVHDLDRRVETTKRLLMAAGLRSISMEQPPTLKDTNIFTIFATRNR